ncbi:hypothetical protein GJ496_007227 [Pomphorhynchus laevis]|nr:hypothetical protein GJ496_007227 [Pomphorhynchus laevis]
MTKKGKLFNERKFQSKKNKPQLDELYDDINQTKNLTKEKDQSDVGTDTGESNYTIAAGESSIEDCNESIKTNVRNSRDMSDIKHDNEPLKKKSKIFNTSSCIKQDNKKQTIKTDAILDSSDLEEEDEAPNTEIQDTSSDKEADIEKFKKISKIQATCSDDERDNVISPKMAEISDCSSGDEHGNIDLERSSKTEDTIAGEETIKLLRKLLKISGIKHIIRKSELDKYSDNKSKIKYLKNLFKEAGYRGLLSENGCKRFRSKLEHAKELAELDTSKIISYEGRSSRSTQRYINRRQQTCKQIDKSSESDSSNEDDILERLKDYVSTD